MFRLLSVCWGKPAGYLLKKIIKILAALCVCVEFRRRACCITGGFSSFAFSQMTRLLFWVFLGFSEMRKTFTYRGTSTPDLEKGLDC